MKPTSSSPLPANAIYLLDTMGYIFRAFHALPPLTNSAGVPTQAVLGVVNMVRKLVQEAHPRALAAVFDVSGPTFRDERFAAYKAQRAPMPEGLSPQLPYIRRALAALQVPCLDARGFEADDVLATLAAQAVAAGDEVVIVSSDKDLLQLVGPHVTVYNASSNAVMDAAAVEAKLGVRPEQVADLLALRGDAVDNIPGAPGIGEKGAQQLIARFGSVEQAMEHAAEVERKTYRESLQNNREQILLSKDLATVHTGAPVEYSPEAWPVREPDMDACRELFTELEFHNLLKVMQAAAPPPVLAPSSRLDAAGLRAWLAEDTAAPLALAILETASGSELGIARGESGHTLAPDAAPALASALADARRGWQWLDSKLMDAALHRLELPRPALAAERIADLTLLAYLADPTRPPFTLDLPPESDAGQAAVAVARAARHLRDRMDEVSPRLFDVYRDIDLPLIPVLEAMESTGVRLDPAPLATLSAELERRCAECQEEVFTLAGERFNLASPQQLSDVLFNRMQLPPPRRRGKTKAYSTAQDVLEELSEHAIVKPILEYRQLSKLKSTYIDALPPLIRPDTGRLHTTFTLAGSATGRLASSNPNLQNIPVRTELGRAIRAAFVADPGFQLVAADYSQIELRLLAHFSQDALLLAAYRGDTDIHQMTAAEVFGVPPLLVTDEHRRRAKAVNFGIVYGLSPFGLAKQLGIPQPEAARFIQKYFERYPGVRAFIDRTLEQARRDDRVETLFGRVRPIPNLHDRNPNLRGFAERTAVNTPLQGTAADLIKLAMIRLHPRLPELGARMLLQVHDELVFEVPEANVAALAAVVKHEMEHVASLAVPLRVEIGAGPNWRDLAPIEEG